MNDMSPAPQPRHPKTLEIGLGVVPWAEPTHRGHPAGYVLPGGERTFDRTRAFAVAREIDRLTSKPYQVQLRLNGTRVLEF